MPAFKAQGVVEALDWDFNPYVAAKGTIPEPTDTQIAEFFTGLKDVIKEARDSVTEGISEDSDPVDIMAALEDTDPEIAIKQMGKMCEVYSRLCSGTPTAESIHQLPMRVRNIFFSWLQQEVMSPEPVSPGGNAEVRSLPVGRAG
jgi:hypothetical protein